MSRRRPVQLVLKPRRPHPEHPSWGGPRPGAGRPKSGTAGVPHRVRAPLASRHPAHVTLRVAREAGNLREKSRFKAIKAALRAGADRLGFRLVHYSVQTNHLHLLVEAKDREALSRGVKGLEVRIARALNARLGRKGSVFADRYHARPLTTPREVRHCLRYVLLNGARHARAPARRLDPCASGAYFDGWRSPARVPPPPPEDAAAGPPVAAPHTWLLRKGWRRGGLIAMDEVPSS